MGGFYGGSLAADCALLYAYTRDACTYTRARARSRVRVRLLLYFLQRDRPSRTKRCCKTRLPGRPVLLDAPRFAVPAGFIRIPRAANESETRSETRLERGDPSGHRNRERSSRFEVAFRSNRCPSPSPNADSNFVLSAFGPDSFLTASSPSPARLHPRRDRSAREEKR